MLSNYLNDPENSFDISAISHGLCLNTKHKQTQDYYLAISNQRWLWEPRPGPGSAMLVVWQVSRWPDLSELWEMTFLMSGVGQLGLGLGAALETSWENVVKHDPPPSTATASSCYQVSEEGVTSRLQRASGSNMLRCLVQSKCNSAIVRSEGVVCSLWYLVDNIFL